MIISTFITTYSHIISTDLGTSSTVFNYIFDLNPLIIGYKGHHFYDYIFGKYIISGYHSSHPFTLFATELRIFSTPLYFGLFWTIIVLLIGFYILVICIILIKSKKYQVYKYLGFSFLGFFLIYFFDIHYPVFIRHGPIELFFIMSGTLSSCYMFQKQKFLK